MKFLRSINYIKLGLVLIAGVFTLASCDKLNGEDEVTVKLPSTLKFTTDKEYNLVTPSDTLQVIETLQKGFTVYGRNINWNKTGVKNVFIQLSIPTPITLGTHDITGTIVYSNDFIYSQLAQSGTVNVESYNDDTNNVKGTFTFKTGSITNGSKIVAVTTVPTVSGSFNINY